MRLIDTRPHESATLDGLTPRYHFRESHSLWVAAPPERTYAAVKDVTLGEMPLARLLFGIRGLRPAKRRSLYQQFLEAGFVVLADEPGRELVLGVVLPQRRGEARPRLQDRAAFAAFDTPGYVKVPLSFLLEPEGAGTRIATETRILATDPAARRSFARYWRLVHGGSALTRRSWLRGLQRRLERGPGS